MSVITRECCNRCMWLGPVNQDGTMRKHQPATLENKWGQPNKVQDMSSAPCPGSNKPFATFGCETVPDPNPLYQEETAVIDVESVPATGSRSVGPSKCIHGRHQYKTLRGTTIPRCESGARYGVWDDNDAGFLHVVDCAQDAVTWAAEQMSEEPDYDMEIKAVCPDHEDQPGYGCEDCSGEGCGAVDADDLDACGDCPDCSGD